MSEEQIQLIMQRGPTPGKIYTLTTGTIRIGRSTDSDLVINDAEMSRQHAQLVQQDDGYAIQDLGSTNGTFVNSQRISSMVPIYSGDVVAFGEAIVLLVQVEWETDSQPIPASIPRPTIGKPQPVTAVSPEPEPIFIPASEPELPPVPQMSGSFQAVTSSPPIPPLTVEDYVAEAVTKRRRRWLLGCAAVVLIFICLCSGALFFLDAYEQGQYLYCGALRPFWAFILGPFGFNPAC